MSINLSTALFRRLKKAAVSEHLLVCSDYDGTLAPISSRPESATLLEGAADALYAIANLPRTRVAIISGRGRNNLVQQSGLRDPLLLIGSHGAELPNSEGRVHDFARGELNDLVEILTPLCKGVAGSWIERKPFGIAIHVRQAQPDEGTHLLELARRHALAYSNIALTEGKAIVELSVSQSTKADAVNWLCRDWNVDPCVIFMGDDVTDETVFATLEGDSVGIKIGSGLSQASFQIPSEIYSVHLLHLLLEFRTSRLVDEFKDNVYSSTQE